MATTPSPRAGLHDVFYYILSYITPDPKDLDTKFEERHESRAARKALACLARSHSSFTRPALAALWRSLPSEQPLENLLCVVGIARRHPKEEWEMATLETGKTSLPMTHGAGWRRFQEYASLVHEIVIDPFVRSEDVPDMATQLQENTFWCRLSSASDDGPVLPRLEIAILRSIRTIRPFDAGLLRLLITPSLRELDIAFIEPSEFTDQVGLLTRALADYLPMQQLERLSLETEDPVPFLDTELLPRLHRNLRDLKLGCSRPFGLCKSIEFSCLRHLTALPKLERLSICLHSWDPFDFPIPIAFSTLRSFEISCYEFGVVGTLFAHVEFPRLHTFALTETHEQSHDLSQRLPHHFHALITKCPSLTTFKWSSRQMWMPNYGYTGARRADAPLATLIAPLLAHRALQHVSLSFRGPIVPHTAADLRAMAEAWPDLETFDLFHEADEKYGWVERYVDIESVVVFARYCPRLCSLSLPVVRFDSSSDELAVVGEWASCAPAPHWLRDLFVEGVAMPSTCSCAYRAGQDEGLRREDVVQFCGLMAKVFRSAVIRSQLQLAIVMTMDSIVPDH